MITAIDSKVMDANSEALGVGVDTLMDNAGKAVADLILERFPDSRVAIFCGRGNNGGDGLAAAFYLKNASVFMIDGDDMRSEASKKMLSRLRCPVSDFTGKEDGFDVLVDAALGTGISGTLRPAYDRCVDFCNGFEGVIVSIDVPSGFGTVKQVVPDITVSMVDSKEGMNEENSGEIVIADIGMPLEASYMVGPGDLLRYPVPKEGSRKGDNGRILIIGGGPYFGAPAMSAKASMRAGADYVRIATPEESFDEIAGWCPEFVMHKLQGDVLSQSHLSTVLGICKDVDAVVIGPGLGRADDTVKAVREFVTKCPLPMVIDADGLFALGRDFRIGRDDVVVTPHLGEFRNLGGKDRDPGDVMDLADRLGCTVVLKGKEDMVSDGDRIRLNGTGCAAMTSAGTGDVLAGTIGGLLSKGMGAFDAACLGAYLAGRAGELAFQKFSYGLIATDVADDVAVALKQGLDRVGL